MYKHIGRNVLLTTITVRALRVSGEYWALATRSVSWSKCRPKDFGHAGSMTLLAT